MPPNAAWADAIRHTPFVMRITPATALAGAAVGMDDRPVNPPTAPLFYSLIISN